MIHEELLANKTEPAEPGAISGRPSPEKLEVIVGVDSIDLGTEGGHSENLCLVRRAAYERGHIPPVVDLPGDGEVARELNLSDIINGRVEVLEGAISIDVREKIRRLDGVASSARSSETVRSRYW